MSHMNQSFDGRVVVITGGARGQGAEEGRMLCAHGATVAKDKTYCTITRQNC